jgi:hypothetical protein
MNRKITFHVLCFLTIVMMSGHGEGVCLGMDACSSMDLRDWNYNRVSLCDMVQSMVPWRRQAL